MIIKVLAENTRINEEFGAEHGLSLYIDTGRHRILFDMGQSDLFEKNAQKLGVDLREVDLAVLSHGHYDHGGGLKRFLEINKKAPVYVNRHAFAPHFSGNTRLIGLDQNLLQEKRLIFTDDTCRIDEELFLCTCNREIPADKIDSAGLLCEEDEKMVPETFRHEQYLVIREGEKRVVISGCSHKGIVNIAQVLCPDVLVGGFHLSKVEMDDKGRNRLKDTALQLLDTGAVFITGHCTGTEQYNYMKQIMKERLWDLSTGRIVEI